MDQVVIVVSDLHLGKLDELDVFVPENERAFCGFLKDQSDSFPNEDVDLVVLGDFVDIWQVATENEKHASKSSQICISINEELDIARVREIVLAHATTFNALRDFLSANPDRRRLICITGNHDHSLIHPTVWDVVTKAIAQGDVLLQKGIDIKNWYENAYLRIYAEHGNQFDEDNDYDNFALFGAEAPGYFFVRLFWNRLEAIQPNLGSWMTSFSAIWKQRLWNLLVPARQLFRQYVWDERPFKRIQAAMSLPPFLLKGQAMEAPSRVENLREFPDLLFTDRVDPEHIFSTDNKLESHLRALYHGPDNDEFNEAVDKILAEKFHGEPFKVPEPSAEMRQLEFLSSDSYVSAVKGMYGPDGPPNGTPCARAAKGGFLKPDVHRFVLLGHTHEEKEETFSNLDVTYFNTGSWTVHRDPYGNNTSRLCYVVFQKNSSGRVIGTQKFWKL